MMSIPYMAGFSHPRWQKIIDIMLEKTPDDPKIHRLRIIALLESDFNQANRMLIARPITWLLEDNDMIPEMQYGSRRGKLCQSAVFNKQLVFDITRYMKDTISIIENDAIRCFDRIANPLVLLILRHLGLLKTVVNSLAQTWEETTHLIRTKYGISDEGNSNDKLNLLFGPGQGATLGPFLWLLCFIIIATNIKPSTPRMHHTSVDKSTTVVHLGESFVDDTSLGCTSSSQCKTEDLNLTSKKDFQSTLSLLAELAQEWKRLLYSTGGALNLQKSFWFTMTWKWRNGTASLATTAQRPGVLRITNGAKTTKEAVPRIEPTETYRTLGVHLSPSGKLDESLRILREQAISFASSIISSHLSRFEAYWSYVIYFIPKICYQLPLLSLTRQQCESLMFIVLEALLPKLHINRNTSRAIIHGPDCLGGMGIINLYTHQGIQKLTLFLGHTRIKDKTGKLLIIGLSYLQLLSGSGTFVLNLSYTTSGSWLKQGWLTSLWEFSTYAKLRFHTATIFWTPKLQRENDFFLMDFFTTLTKNSSILKALNHCRLYLQVLLVSDIATADGHQLLPEVKSGSITDRISSLKWPSHGRPSTSDWTPSQLKLGQRL